MEEAERIAREEHGSVKLAVISGMLELRVWLAQNFSTSGQRDAYCDF